MDPVDRGVAALAAGRVALGAASVISPGHTIRAFGMTPAPELTYMTQIFGIRAIALGLAWSLTRERDRRLMGRLGLMCDLSDTVAGLARLRAGDIPRASALALVGTTGGYAIVGLARLAACQPRPGPDMNVM